MHIFQGVKHFIYPCSGWWWWATNRWHMEKPELSVVLGTCKSPLGSLLCPLGSTVVLFCMVGFLIPGGWCQFQTSCPVTCGSLLDSFAWQLSCWWLGTWQGFQGKHCSLQMSWQALENDGSQRCNFTQVGFSRMSLPFKFARKKINQNPWRVTKISHFIAAKSESQGGLILDPVIRGCSKTLWSTSDRASM